MSGFQVGGLALVVACPQVPENVGCVVELVQSLQPGDLYVAPSNGDTRFSAGVGWLVTGRVQGMGRRPNGEIFLEYGHALFSEQRLMPLSGDLQLEYQKRRETEPCA